MKKWWMSFIFSCIFCMANDNNNYAPKVQDTDNNKIPEKPIAVIIASYNNAHICERNLRSVFCQKYENFRVLYTNDASTDGTERVIRKLIRKHEWENFHYKRNSSNKGAAYNQYEMIQQCQKDEIVVILDGDDFLLHDMVFDRINRAYADPNVWATYAQFSTRTSRKGESVAIDRNILKEGLHRELPWRTYGLRNFYAGLYHKIPKHCWLYHGKHYPCTIDVLQIYYIMDLAREHTYFIPEPLMYYNLDTSMNDSHIRRKKQKHLEHYIRSIKPLDRIDEITDFL